MTNVFILCDLVWKVQKSHAANREGSFKVDVPLQGAPMNVYIVDNLFKVYVCWHSVILTREYYMQYFVLDASVK